MLPSSSFLSPGSQDAKAVPPPYGFRGLQLPLKSVEMKLGTTFRDPKGNSVAKENGIRYEKHVHEFLTMELGGRYSPSPEFEVVDTSRRRLLIPDGLFFHEKHIVLFEVKSQHMPEAWWQLRRLYQPIVEFKLKRPVFVVEIVKSYDPAMPFPERVHLIDDLREHCERPRSGFGVFQWKP